jgi:glutathione S-transferase
MRPGVSIRRTDEARDKSRKGILMRLHTFVGSPNGRKVEAVINHLKIAVEIVYHDFLAGDLRRPDFLDLNPNGKVPVLVDGTFVLWESDAIMHYLAEHADDQVLLPRDLRRRAEVLRWQFWAVAHFNKAFGTLAFETVAKPMLKIGPTDGAAVDAAKIELARFAPVLDGHLQGREFLVGNALTLADYAMVKLESYQAKIPFDWAPFGHANAYFERMRRVEAWARTAPPSHEATGRKPAAAA